jgi:hypothetical protein
MTPEDEVLSSDLVRLHAPRVRKALAARPLAEAAREAFVLFMQPGRVLPMDCDIVRMDVEALAAELNTSLRSVQHLIHTVHAHHDPRREFVVAVCFPDGNALCHILLRDRSEAPTASAPAHPHAPRAAPAAPAAPAA